MRVSSNHSELCARGFIHRIGCYDQLAWVGENYH